MPGKTREPEKKKTTKKPSASNGYRLTAKKPAAKKKQVAKKPAAKKKTRKA